MAEPNEASLRLATKLEILERKVKYLEEITHEMNGDVRKGVVRIVAMPKTKPKDFHEKMKGAIDELSKKIEFSKIKTSAYYVDVDMKDTTKAKANVELAKASLKRAGAEAVARVAPPVSAELNVFKAPSRMIFAAVMECYDQNCDHELQRDQKPRTRLPMPESKIPAISLEDHTGYVFAHGCYYKETMVFHLKVVTPVKLGRAELGAEELIESLKAKWVHPFRLQAQINKRTPDGLPRAPNFSEWKARQREARR